MPRFASVYSLTNHPLTLPPWNDPHDLWQMCKTMSPLSWVGWHLHNKKRETKTPVTFLILPVPKDSFISDTGQHKCYPTRIWYKLLKLKPWRELLWHLTQCLAQDFYLWNKNSIQGFGDDSPWVWITQLTSQQPEIITWHHTSHHVVWTPSAKHPCPEKEEQIRRFYIFNLPIWPAVGWKQKPVFKNTPCNTENC